ncbi:MAG: folate-binding protein YgfZ [Tatlockia sp.]|nr:folate-binding protein YgfZ [Tatlockia sp.]
MNFSPFILNNRELSIFTTLEAELKFEPEKNYLFDLSYLTVIAVEGEKAQDFLQGQLSCDLRLVNPHTIRQGAICNLKGRILALMDVINWRGFKLVLPKDLSLATENSLSKIAMLSKVNLKLRDSYQIFGFYLTNPDDLLPENFTLPWESLELSANEEACCYSLSKQFYLLIIDKEKASHLSAAFINKQQFRGSLAWHQLQLKRKSIEIYPETRGLFLPHRLDLHLSGHLNFEKGCYKGQEIIARTHYRATLKHSLELFSIESSEPLEAGAKLFTLEQKTEVGELVDYCPLEANNYLIAVSILKDAPKQVLIEKHLKPVQLISLSSRE